MTRLRVSAGVLTRGSRILICQRRAHDLHPSKWEFPGGKAHDDEDGATCLRRELREELGVDATIGAELTRTTFTYPNGRSVSLQFFHVPEFRGELVNTQFQAIAWVELADLSSYDFLEGDVDFVAALARGDWMQIFSSP